jgi:hypothetical protein
VTNKKTEAMATFGIVDLIEKQVQREMEGISVISTGGSQQLSNASRYFRRRWRIESNLYVLCLVGQPGRRTLDAVVGKILNGFCELLRFM